MNIKKSSEIALDNFLKLPRRAQLLFFNDLEEDMNLEMKNKPTHSMFMAYSLTDAFNTTGCKSPIEQLLAMALKMLSLGDYFYFEPQKEIATPSGKKYFVDFAIYYDNGDYPDEYIVLVECDGHEFHNKTKEQVRRDNERDYNIKMAGYDILHYSGSQIYEDPFKCAKDIYSYCKKKIGVDHE